MNKMKRIIVLFLCWVAFGQVLAQSPLEVKKTYLVADFSAKDLDAVLDLCHEGGIEYLLERSPFATYGHYQWNPEFAANDKAVAEMVQKAEAVGVHLGLLVHSDAISENDAFFKPKYSQQFLREGRVELFSDIEADEVDIALVRNETIKGVSSLNLLLVENELISYGTIEQAGDLLLLHRCTRGAYGTRAAAHSAKAEAFKIWDSPERYVAPDETLRDSVRMHLNRRIEAAGVTFVLQAGDPGQELLDGSLRIRHVERWTSDEGVAKSGCLGWVNIHAADKKRSATSLDEVEWMLSKSVGFDAGFGLLMDKKAIKEHGRLDEIFQKIRQWNQFRQAHVLSKMQLEELQDPYLDWHLAQDDSTHVVLSQWNFSRRYRCNFVEADSLLIGAEPWEWKADEETRFGLRLQVDGNEPIVNPMINTDKGLVMFPCTIQPRQCLVYDFEDVAYVMDGNFNTLNEAAIEGISVLPEGSSTVRFYCETEKEGSRPEVTVRYVVSSLMVRFRY